jgi:hypothetical protein
MEGYMFRVITIAIAAWVLSGCGCSEAILISRSTEAPALELVGPPVEVDDALHIGGSPVVAWSGSTWGVMWSELDMSHLYSYRVFRQLDEFANPISPIQEVSTSPAAHGGDIEWHLDHFTFVFTSMPGEPGEYRVEMGAIDETGDPITSVLTLINDSTNPMLAWSEEANGWIVSYVKQASRPYSLEAVLVDDAILDVSDPVWICEGAPESHTVISHGALTAFVWASDEYVELRSIRWPDALSSPAAHQILAWGPTDNAPLAADWLSDRTLVVTRALVDEPDEVVVAVQTDTHDVLHGPSILGPAFWPDKTPGLTAVPDNDYAGVCWVARTRPVEESGWEAVLVQLIESDGTPIDEAVEIAVVPGSTSGCALGWSGREFVVLYWSTGLGTVENTIYAQRVRPLI